MRTACLIAAASTLLLALAGCGVGTCGPSNCAGCCDASGVCQPPGPLACGAAGASCLACMPGQICDRGACAYDSPGSSGPSTSSGASSAGSTSGASSTSGTSTSGTSGTSTSGASSTTSSGASGTTTSGAGSTTTSGAGSTSTSTGGAHAPYVQSLTADPTILSQNGSTTISALVSDPDGQSTLSGGTLTDKDTGYVYGVFGTPGGQGTFQFVLNWSDLQRTASINFGPGGATRALIATFHDADNHAVSAELDLGLSCGPTGSACDGQCLELSTDPYHCGTCGNTLPAWGQTCQSGRLACPGSQQVCSDTCVDTQTDTGNCGGCGIQVSGGGSCVNGQPTCPAGQLDCNGLCVPDDESNCGTCGNSCDAWGQAHGVSRGLQCREGQCVAEVEASGQITCSQLCIQIGWGLSCVRKESCALSSTDTATDVGGCAWYLQNSTGDYCLPQVELGCDEQPHASVPSCSSSGSSGPGTLSVVDCTCG